MKKILALILAVVAVFALAVPAFAMTAINEYAYDPMTNYVQSEVEYGDFLMQDPDSTVPKLIKCGEGDIGVRTKTLSLYSDGLVYMDIDFKAYEGTGQHDVRGLMSGHWKYKDNGDIAIDWTGSDKPVAYTSTLHISETEVTMDPYKFSERIPVLDEEGNVVKDENGWTVYEVVCDEEGKPVTDSEGNTKYVYRTVSEVLHFTGDSSIINNWVPFDDVGKNAWYRESVVYAYQHNLVAGTAKDMFSPNVGMTRAMMVTILYRMAGSPSVVYNAEDEFDDVKNGSWYHDAVMWAFESGITAGTAKGKFSPDEIVTREQVACFLYAYAKGSKTDVNLADMFPDGDETSTWAQDAVKWAVTNKLISGIKNGDTVTLCPHDTATRAQVVTVLANFAKMK